MLIGLSIKAPDPIWKGIVSEDGTQMLLAAYNPYSVPPESTTIVIDYHGTHLESLSKGRTPILVSLRYHKRFTLNYRVIGCVNPWQQ